MFDMFERIFSATPGSDDGADEHDARLRLAATALLFRALQVDGSCDASETAQIRRIVTDAFGLDEAATAELMQQASAEAVEATDLFRWTRLINSHYSPEDKAFLMEKCWQVILADGVIDSHESALMRRVAGLLHVSDRQSAEARQRATSFADEATV